MAVHSYDAVAEKILSDLELAIRKDVSINEFDVIPTLEAENKNSSPILKSDCTIALESWIIPHIYPYAHHQIMDKKNYKMQNLEKLKPCLLGVVLLNPDMPAAWSRRRELIMSRKLTVDNELRLTIMALSRKPKCNEALAHRRWIITEILKDVESKGNILREELNLCEMIANRYHSNYHAWSHRMWAMQHLIPNRSLKKKSCWNENTQSDSSKPNTHISSISEFCSIVSFDTLQLYSNELENNFKWVSCHVSDHSGLHYRKFLINKAIDLLKNSMSLTCKIELDEEMDDAYHNTVQHQYASAFCRNKKTNISEFFKSFEFGNHYKKVIYDYVENLKCELTLFDVIMSIIIAEFESNHSLCTMYPGHEALWYYRRFLIFLSKQTLDSYDACQSTNESKLFSHQDKNGVPYHKDFKYDYNSKGLSNEEDFKHSDMFLIYYNRILSNEQDIIMSGLNSNDEHTKKLVRNYSNWLKQCLKISDKMM